MADVRLNIQNQIAHLVFDAEGKPVNVLSTQVRDEIERLLNTLKNDKSIKAMIVESPKPKIFIAGADIKEIESISDVATAAQKAKSGQVIMDAIEDLPFPTVAAINGACLGGGLELAMACDYRVASSSDVQIGLPEVKLGIIPGFGGTFRLPRLTGLQKGLEMILQGKVVDANRAFKAGLVDNVVAPGLLPAAAMEILEQNGFKKRKYGKQRKPLMSKILEDTPFGKSVVSKQAKKTVMQTTRGHYPAPLVAVDVVVKNYGASRHAAMKFEEERFGELVGKGTHKKLVQVFYLMERYKKEKWSEAKPLPVNHCGVLGAGVMGGGVAQIVAENQIPVRLKDITAEALLLGLRSAAKVFVDLVTKRRLLKSQAESLMGLITTTTDYSGFSHSDVVIEAVVENLEVKKKVFAELDGATNERAILASNTSALSVTAMSKSVKNPGRVVGMHFFNPVHKMPLIEIIRGEHTSEEAIATIVAFSRKLKKTPIVVQDKCGFLVNRLLLPYLNEAGHLAEEGVSLEQIDKVLLDFGMPMGAFILLDEIGLDVGQKVCHVLEDAFGERMKAITLLDKFIEKKWLGRKTGKGFYIHTGKERVLNPEAKTLIGNVSKNVSDEEILERCIYMMINEAAHCVEEKVCREAADVDIGMIMGTGFPPFRAGLMRYADDVGIAKIVERLRHYRKQTGAVRFEPAKLLVEMSEYGRKFYA